MPTLGEMGRTTRRKKLDQRRARELTREVAARAEESKPLILLASPRTKTGAREIALPTKEPAEESDYAKRLGEARQTLLGDENDPLD
jgi:hypothetical protein